MATSTTMTRPSPLALFFAFLLWNPLHICTAAPEEPESPGLMAPPEVDMDKEEETRPNLILLVVDDWGFNDVSWHEHSDISMPFLQEHVKNEALAIDTFYTYTLCSISRAALLTGRYPSRYGLHYGVIENGYSFGLSIFETTIAEEMKAAGYNTAMVGKWHQGFHRNDMTPLQRGFDYFYGSLSPMVNFWTYYYSVTGTRFGGTDLWKMNDPVSYNDTYLTYWERDHFMKTFNILMDDPDETPFFMYVALHASHYPHAAPEDAVDLAQELSVCDDDAYDPHHMLQCSSHQTVQGQTIVGDEVINEMITKLKETRTRDGSQSVWDNTVLFFLSDNGGAVWEMDNSPLRGGKLEIFEGGVRTPAFVSGGYLDSMKKGGIFGDGTIPFHVTDVYPTFLKLAGVSDEERLGERVLDGMNQLQTIQYGTSPTEEPREFVYNLYPADECGDNEWCGAYRFGDFKLIWHNNADTDTTMWWYDFYATSRRYNEDGSKNQHYTNYLECTNIPDDVATSVEYDIDGNSILSCKSSPCLFNIAEDACEYNDLSGDSRYEAVYQYMYLMMKANFDNQQAALKLEVSTMDNRCDPSLRGGFWSPWVRDYNHNDATEDFEDILTKYAQQNGITEDLRSNKDYIAAQGFKVQWLEQQQQQKEREMEHGRSQAKMDQTMIWIMIAVITALLIGLFISNKICKMRSIAKRIQQYPVDIRIQYEDEYSPLVK